MISGLGEIKFGRVGLRRVLSLALCVGSFIVCGTVLAHGISGDDQAFLLRSAGAHIGPYIYLGATHMVPGYDHLLFHTGELFFLYRLKEVAIYVTLFAVGHSTTRGVGGLGGLHGNA